MKRRVPALAVIAVLAVATAPGGAADPSVGTYSIVAFDERTGDLGVAVQSCFLAVGAVVPWARARVGAVATQAQANTGYGPEGLRLLATGAKPAQAIRILTGADPDRERRQVGMVDASGAAAAFTGSRCGGWAGHRVGDRFAVQGNTLAGGKVLEAMASAYVEARKTPGTEMADWLLAALEAAERAGGDRRGRQSAAMLVVREKGGYGGFNDRHVDLRVDDHPDPVTELGRLLRLSGKGGCAVPR